MSFDLVHVSRFDMNPDVGQWPSAAPGLISGGLECQKQIAGAEHDDVLAEDHIGSEERTIECFGIRQRVNMQCQVRNPVDLHVVSSTSPQPGAP